MNIFDKFRMESLKRNNKIEKKSATRKKKPLR